MRRTLLAVLTCLTATAGLATAAEAARLTLSCAGAGPRDRDGSGNVRCAASPTRGRTIAGVVRNDANQPVAGRVTVTTKTWTPSPGGGYAVRPTATRQITANSAGAFSFPTNPQGRQELEFALAADPALGIAAGAEAEAEVARRLNVSLAKLGGGRIRITVAGTAMRPIKVYIIDSTAGYRVPGVSPRNVDNRGRAFFSMGARRGTFAYYVEPRYRDLFWDLGRPKFRMP